MLQGKIVATGDKYSVELLNGETFKISKDELPDSLKENGTQVNVSFSSIGESVDQGQAIDIVNHLLQIS
ncbi:MAG: hypothetical protein HOC83_00025 [Polaribacter sp.]|jgi:hypothetical protein|nr:hypothetical protein [Polaribacter sp.]